MRLLWLLLLSVLLFGAVLAKYDDDATKPGEALPTSPNGTRMRNEVNLNVQMGPSSVCGDCPEKVPLVPLWVRRTHKKLRRTAQTAPEGPSQIFHVKAIN